MCTGRYCIAKTLFLSRNCPRDMSFPTRLGATHPKQFVSISDQKRILAAPVCAGSTLSSMEPSISEYVRKSRVTKGTTGNFSFPRHRGVRNFGKPPTKRVLFSNFSSKEKVRQSSIGFLLAT